MYRLKLSVISKESGELIKTKVVQNQFKRTLVKSLSVVIDNYLKDSVGSPYILEFDNIPDMKQELNLPF